METPSSARIRLLCVDDNPLVAKSLSIKFRTQPDFDWAGHVSTADNLPATVAALRPDIVLLDLDMPGREPMAALAEIAKPGAGARFIVLSGYMNRELIDRAISAGAWGYLSKSDGEDFIVQAVRRVHAGEFVLSQEVQAKLGHRPAQ